jgi:hypothetical protein
MSFRTTTACGQGSRPGRHPLGQPLRASHPGGDLLDRRPTATRPTRPAIASGHRDGRAYQPARKWRGMGPTAMRGCAGTPDSCRSQSFSPVDSLVMTYPPPHQHPSPAIFRRAAGSWKAPRTARPMSPATGPWRRGRAIQVGACPGTRISRPVRCGSHCRRGRQARRSLRASGFIPSCRPRQRVVSQPRTRRPVPNGPAGSPARRVRPAAPGGRKEKPGAKSSSVCCQSRRGWLVLAEIHATLLWGRPAMP